ncbi:NRDE family protein [Olivibacter sp. CPCC 100613]|uniref:NRDE family protein n=1 Tax=Olivibacter sp. CPCC 100613 TaxID=3079931 RepID=UPI002FF7B94B
MCTVTFIPTAAGIHLTSNRDEHVSRKTALAPREYSRKDTKLIFPKDQEAGGTWIALKANGDAAVLLNGAFIKHQRALPYKRSRGHIFLDIMEKDNVKRQFDEIDLLGIEPFTLIIYGNRALWECRWDGLLKHNLQLHVDHAYIWSSATLYEVDIAHLRRHWFEDWLKKNRKKITCEDIFDFHFYAGEGNLQNDLVISRSNGVRTVSVTSVFVSEKESSMSYRDLVNEQATEKKILTQTHTSSKSYLTNQQCSLIIRRCWLRLTQWEYWPAAIIFGPLFIHWVWLSLKARSFFFFSAANPGIANGGFLQEKKSDIYRLIPKKYYPRTLFCESDITPTILAEKLSKAKLKFPLIAKPDQGRRGMQVKLVKTKLDLENYRRNNRVHFLVQEYIDYELEAGIFYYRFPGEKKGCISGIVGKEFLSVTGDGKSTIANLIKRNDRALFQLEDLYMQYGPILSNILPKGIKQILVPYGNHSRGSKFVDLNHYITEELTTTIDQICQQVPGFYYGRLDIKFHSWEELEKGCKFSIIELNGAGSEPTHIYDPQHSLFFAWKEIYRHWQILYQISKINAQQKGIDLMRIRDGIKMIKEHRRFKKLITQL